MRRSFLTPALWIPAGLAIALLGLPLVALVVRVSLPSTTRSNPENRSSAFALLRRSSKGSTRTSGLRAATF